MTNQGKDTTPFKIVCRVPGYLQGDNNIFRSNSRDEDCGYVSVGKGPTGWHKDKLRDRWHSADR